MITDRPTGNGTAGGRQALAGRELLDKLLRDGACDLHLHTAESDGSDTPQQLVDRVLAAGLKAFAITDHDRISALMPARLYLDRLSADPEHMCPLPIFIPGVELSTDLDGHELHLLGYFPQGGTELLAVGRPGFVARPLPSVFAAIDQIHQAGGLAVLAHPDQYGWCSGSPVVAGNLLRGLVRLCEAGLDGVEAYHSEASPARQAEIAAAGRSLGLILTAGSDDHGAIKGKMLLYDRNSCWTTRKEWLVAGALLSRTDARGQIRYLICRRRSPGRHAGLWELPGGKVEVGESVEEALRRELMEELAVDAQIGPVLNVLWHDYPGERVILAILEARFDTGHMAENAHDCFLFVTPEEALRQALLPADVVLFEHLAKQKCF